MCENGLHAWLRMYIYKRLCRLASLSAHLSKSAAKIYFQRKRHVASSCTNGYNTYSLGYAIIYLLHTWPHLKSPTNSHLYTLTFIVNEGEVEPCKCQLGQFLSSS